MSTSCYIRIPFSVESDPNNFSSLKLSLQYDDGFVGYLNGTKVARANFSGTPQWNSKSDGDHDDVQAVVFEDFNIPEHVSELVMGDNVLAISSSGNRHWQRYKPRWI